MRSARRWRSHIRKFPDAGRLLRLRRLKHDLGFDLMPRLRLVFGQLAAACSNLAIALRDGKDPSDVRVLVFTA